MSAKLVDVLVLHATAKSPFGFTAMARRFVPASTAATSIGLPPSRFARTSAAMLHECGVQPFGAIDSSHTVAQFAPSHAIAGPGGGVMYDVFIGSSRITFPIGET